MLITEQQIEEIRVRLKQNTEIMPEIMPEIMHDNCITAKRYICLHVCLTSMMDTAMLLTDRDHWKERAEALEAELATYKTDCEYKIFVPSEHGYAMEGLYYKCSCGAVNIGIEASNNWIRCPYCGKWITSFETFACVTCRGAEWDKDFYYCKERGGKYRGEEVNHANFDGCKMYSPREEAEASLAERSTQLPEWISVNDRLPDQEKRVLMCVNERVVFEGWLGDAGWLRYDNNRPVSTWLGTVTHWMPLPEPPKEVGNEAKP